MAQLRGGKFINGFISGFASKAVSGIMDNTDLRFEPPFVKMSINVILSGAISKASGGDFYQGAMSALVVYLYNDLQDWMRVLGLSDSTQNNVRKIITFAKKVKKEAEINEILYEEHGGKYLDTVATIASGVSATKVANIENNKNPAYPKDFYKGKGGAIIDFIKKPRFPATAYERTLPAIAGGFAWQIGKTIGNYGVGIWNVSTNNCYSGACE